MGSGGAEPRLSVQNPGIAPSLWMGRHRWRHGNWGAIRAPPPALAEPEGVKESGDSETRTGPQKLGPSVSSPGHSPGRLFLPFRQTGELQVSP